MFGKGAENRTAELVKKYGGSRVFVVYGGGSAVRSGLLDRVMSQLLEAGITCEAFGGAQPNPLLSHAEEGVRKAIAFNADMILAVGGGSAIDTAKGIAHGVAAPEKRLWDDIWLKAGEITASLPVGVILTIPAAGSEMSNSAVLTNETIHRKRGLSTDFNRPRFAIMNPELTASLPPYQVACGVTDIMMHTLDRYFSPIDNDLTDEIAEALLRVVIRHGKTAVDNPADYDAMSELMWAGSLSHNGLTGLGQSGDWAVHQIGHELSASFGIAHGASLATVWGSWARYVCNMKPSRFARYARKVWDIDESDDATAVQKGIEATEDYFRSIGMPVCFSEGVGLQSDETCDALGLRVSFENTRTVGQLRVLGAQDVAAIYKCANH